jgi:hypothetical protein
MSQWWTSKQTQSVRTLNQCSIRVISRLRVRQIVPLLAKRNTEHGSGLGRWRWVVERTFA